MRRTQRRERSGPGATLVLAALLALLAPTASCRRRAPATRPAETQEARKVEMPGEVPGLGEVEDDPGATEVMVKGRYDRGERETYRHERGHPAGTLAGGCRFTDCKGMEVPADEVVDLRGRDAIKDPQPGEEEFYRNIGVRRPWSCEQLRRRRQVWVAKRGEEYIPCNVVVMLRGVKVGRREALTRPVMAVRQGLMGPGGPENHGGNDVQFGPLHERAQFTTWDKYPSELVLTEADTGRVVCEKAVRYRQTEERRVTDEPGEGRFAYRPEYAITEPLRRAGLYVLACRRHPWQRAYLWVVDNPYVTTTEWEAYRNPLCNFRIENVPPGTHTVEVWHPVFQPVKRTFEVTIEADRIKELMIYFHPPAKDVFEKWKAGGSGAAAASQPSRPAERTGGE